MSSAQVTAMPDAAAVPQTANPQTANPQTANPQSADPLVERFREVRQLTDQLTRDLSPEDQTPQSMTEASPVKWHRAHTTWFFEEFVLSRLPGHEPVDPAYRFLFNSYYEAVGARHPRPERGLVTRPGVGEVGRYRDVVTQQVCEALEQGRLDEPARALVGLGCHHEQQHQELLLMDLKHLLSHNAIQPAFVERAEDDLDAAAAPQRWTTLPAGVHEIGHAGDGFAFDNESPRHRVWVDNAQVATRQVTNAEWCEFIADDGYGRPELWLSDGWATVQEQGWEAPGYWQREDDGSWSTFTLSGRRPVVPTEPACHVSFFEADAFARWAGARLPTEAEWEVYAASGPARAAYRLLDPDRAHPGVVGEDVLGDVWEWTASAYLPYPGFAPAEGAVGEYNGKFMNDQHVLRGASAVTPPGHERLTYRNFFPAASRWVFSGVRLAR